MVFKTALLCLSAFLVQSIDGNCIRPNCGPSICDNGCTLVATSYGPVSPSGLAVATDLALAGNLDLCGTLPFLSAVAFEGSYPTSGSAAVNYGCGDGNVGITQEIGNPGGINAIANSGLNINGVGIGSCGCRCG